MLGRRLLLLQLLDAFLRHCQLLLQHLIFSLQRARLGQQLALPRLSLAQVLHHLAESLQELAKLLFQLRNFFFWRHALSLSERSFLNNIGPVLSPQLPNKERRFIPPMNHRGFRARLFVSC
jgi:hypothetical protein